MAQIFERGQFYCARFRHNGKDDCRSTGVKLPKRGATKDTRLAALLSGQGNGGVIVPSAPKSSWTHSV